ncbi:hypothetical protein DFS34DRAFT_188376 [Phlyctochytrium arcticum]|nr:hypothetical protein DFS34DRAFT_188376 [Phlyctochytrium arcticum]
MSFDLQSPIPLGQAAQFLTTSLNSSIITLFEENDDRKRKAKSGIIVPLGTFFSIGIMCFFIFCCVRTYMRDIYSPRRGLSSGRPPKLPKGLFAWIPVVFRMPEALVVRTVGMDAIVLLRFFKMGATFFATLTFFGLSIVAPVNYYANPPSFQNSTGILYEDVLIPALSVENIPLQSRMLWIHLFCTWFFSLIAYAFLISYYRGIVTLRLAHVDHVLRRTKMSKIEMRSIIVFGIPRELRHEVDLAGYFENLGIGKVENVVICRKWTRLREAVQNRAYYLMKLENVYARVMRNLHRRPRSILSWRRTDATSAPPRSVSYQAPDRSNGIDLSGAQYGAEHDAIVEVNEDQPFIREPYGMFDHEERHISSTDGVDASIFEVMTRLDAVDPRKRPTHRTGLFGMRGPTVDSADYYSQKFKEWDQKVHRLRRSPDSSPATSAGFVTFESPESAILAAQVLINSKPFACMARQAPEPRDIFWVNLSSQSAVSHIKLFRSMFVAGTLLVLVFFSTIIVTAISALISLDKLQSTFPRLKDLLENLGPGWTQFIQGVIPAVVTAAWTSSLPGVLILLSQIQGLEAQSWIDASVLSKYFFYQLWNILLVQTIASKVWQSLVDIIRHGPGVIIDALGNLVPSAAPLQINYVMLQATAVYPAQLLLVGPLLLTGLFRIAPWARSTPRQTSDAYYPSVFTSINYGMAFPVPILVFCVGITYAPVAPLILPFCTLFYTIAFFIYKYILLYVNIPRYETGGKLAPMVVRRCLVGIVIMQLTMMGVLALKAGSGLKAVGEPDADSSLVDLLEDKKLRWSGYVQMVVGVAPLIFLTGLLYWWFKHGFEKLMLNTPLDLVGDVARDMARASNLNIGTDGVVVGEVEKGKELAPVAAAASASRSQDRHSVAGSSVGNPPTKRASIRAVRGRVRKGSSVSGNAPAPGDSRTRTHSGTNGENASDFEDDPYYSQPTTPLSTSIPSSSSHYLPGASTPTTSPHRPAPLLQRPSFTPLRIDNRYSSAGPRGDLYGEELAQDDSFADEDNDDHEDDALLGAGAGRSPSHLPHFSNDDDDAFSVISDLEDAHPTPHLEPPMTRVPGVLDVPFRTASAIIPAGDEGDAVTALHSDNENPNDDDIQVHTYIHPALIGRLPVAWVLGASQPRRVEEAREAQKRGQRGLYRRIVGRQRVGVWELAAESGQQYQENNEFTNSIGSFSTMAGSPDSGSADSVGRLPNAPVNGRVRRGRKDSTVVRKVMSFVDGVTSWAHLSMS